MLQYSQSAPPARTLEIFDGIRPPGKRVVPYTKPSNPSHLASSTTSPATKPVLLKSNETPHDLPLLPPEQAKEVERYFLCAMASSYPRTNSAKPHSYIRELLEISPGIKDAFTTEIDGQHLLPEELRHHNWVHQCTATLFKKTALSEQFYDLLPAPGEISDRFYTHLSDSVTGLSAAIFYDRDRREIIIAFGPMGSIDMKLEQYIQSAQNVAGFIPPNMAQAADLTRCVKKHIKELNSKLPPHQQIKLTLTGQSMGGGLASYAALRHKVPAVVTNPMRLGYSARAAVGLSTLKDADLYLTEVIVQGDWVSDNWTSKLYLPLKLLGFDSYGPLGSARRFLLPPHPTCRSSHDHLRSSLGELHHHHSVATVCMPSLTEEVANLSNKARMHLVQGHVGYAIKEALDPKYLTFSGSPNRGIVLPKKSGDVTQNILTRIDYSSHISRLASLMQRLYDSQSRHTYTIACKSDKCDNNVRHQLPLSDLEYARANAKQTRLIKQEIQALQDQFPATKNHPLLQAILKDLAKHQHLAGIYALDKLQSMLGLSNDLVYEAYTTLHPPSIFNAVDPEASLIACMDAANFEPSALLDIVFEYVTNKFKQSNLLETELQKSWLQLKDNNAQTAFLIKITLQLQLEYLDLQLEPEAQQFLLNALIAIHFADEPNNGPILEYLAKKHLKLSTLKHTILHYLLKEAYLEDNDILPLLNQLDVLNNAERFIKNYLDTCTTESDFFDQFQIIQEILKDPVTKKALRREILMLPGSKT